MKHSHTLPLLPPHSCFLHSPHPPPPSLSTPLTLHLPHLPPPSPSTPLPCHSPWTDKYDTAEHNRYSEPVRVFVSSHLSQLKSEAVVHSHEEYSTIEGRSHPVCSLSEVQRKRKGVVADMGIGEDELVIEYKVRDGGGREERKREDGLYLLGAQSQLHVCLFEC